MATQTVLDLPAITYVDEGDVCYLIRGIGAGRDKQINVEDGLIPKLLTFTTSSSINLASYNGDLTIYGTGSIALTFTGTLRDGKQLIIMNKGTGTISCAGTITASLRQYESLTGISDSSTMAVTRNATNDTSGNLLAYGNILGSGYAHVDGVIKSGTTGVNGFVQVARTSDGAAIGTFYTDGDDVLLRNTSGTGSLVFQINSTEQMRLNTAGQLLIGTDVAPMSTTIFKQAIYSASTASFTMYQTLATGTGDGNGAYIGYSDTAGINLVNYEDTGIRFGTNNIERMTISNTGVLNARFGAIFDSTVDINGALTTKAITLDTGSNLIVGTGTSTFGGAATFNSTVDINGALTTKAITLDDGSNLVVTNGATTLNGNVDIAGYNYTNGAIKSGTTGTNGYIQVARSSDGAAIGTFYTDGDDVLLRNASGTGSLVFQINSTEQMSLNASGQLLIGTDVAPASTTIFKQAIYSASTASFTMYQTLATGTGNGNGAYIGYSDSTGINLVNYEDTGIRFATNNLERMTISNTGILTLTNGAVFNSTVDINGNTTVDGTLTTSDELTIDASATKASMRMQTSLTGSGTSDGVQISYDGISGLVFNNQESTSMRFYTAGTERLSISSIGIVTSTGSMVVGGTLTPSVLSVTNAATLNGTVDINGTLTTKDITVESGSELTVISGITRLTGGLVGKGVITLPDVYTSTTALASNVYINSGGQLYRCSSSRKTKENERPLEVDTTKVYDIEVVTFDMKNTGETGHGPIAEDIAEVEPNFATYDINNEPEAIHTNTVLYALLEEVKKLKSRIEFLEGGI